jgi:hypothetical protein
VIDVDTIDVSGQCVRLFGIDAPEASQTCGAIRCGRQATDAIRGLVGGRGVACEPRDTDRHGRTMAVCYAGGGHQRLDGRGWLGDVLRPIQHRYVALEGETQQSAFGICRYGKSVEKP